MFLHPQRSKLLFLLLVLVPCSAQQPSKTGAATASGTCAVAHNGNNDVITIKNCGIGKDQADKIIALLKAALSNRDLDSVNRKLDELIAAAEKPSQIQNCVGSACAQGEGSQATINQYGVRLLLMSPYQASIITQAVQPFAGAKVHLRCRDLGQEMIDYCTALAGALQAAGILVDGPHYPSPGSTDMGSPGLIVSYSEDMLPFLNAFANGLRAANQLDRPLPVFPEPGENAKGVFDIEVCPKH